MTSSSSLRVLLRARATFERSTTVVRGWRVTTRRATASPRRDAPAVVLLPGLALTGRYLLPVAQVLASRFPVWVADLPGYGHNEGPTLPVADLGAWVVEWMDAVGLPRAALLGSSMGCQVAVEAAVQHPDRVDAVVLQGPTMDPAARSVRAHLPRLARAGAHEPRSLTPLQVVDYLATGPRAMVAGTRHAFAHRVEDRATAVACPALVVRGAADPIVPQRWAEQLTAALPRGELRVVPGATHTMPYRDPLELARVVEHFLAGPTPPTG